MLATMALTVATPAWADTVILYELSSRPGREFVIEADDAAKANADDDSFPQWPDLVIIDGGRGQLNAVREIFEGLGLTQVSLMAVAKGPDRDAGRETLFMPDREAIKLEPRDPVLYFIQRLRDEAHRFVIGSHRKLRKKDIREAGLQEIPGIGPWTIEYVALRALGDPDAYPATDIALINALGRKGETLEHLKPWRAYAAIRLWRRGAKKGMRP